MRQQARWRSRAPRRALLALGIVAALTGTAPAGAGTLSCGEVVTTDVTLTASLTGCTDGLTVGADGITIDLNGKTISGLGTDSGTGINGVGRSHITVKNGTIRSFAVGVAHSYNRDSTGGWLIADLRVSDTVTGIRIGGLESENVELHEDQVVDNRIKDSETGIAVFQSGIPVRVSGNRVTGLTGGATGQYPQVAGTAIFCRGPAGGRVLIERNELVQNTGSGISLFFCSADVVGNDTSYNGRSGIHRILSNGLVERNVANGNGGDGINNDDAHGVFRDNVTDRNVANGLLIVDQIPEHGPFFTVTNHEANGNGALGIGAFTTTGVLEGVIDGGGNRAKNNGDPRQCVSVVCVT